MVAFNYHSRRAREARFGERLEKIRWLLILLAIVFLLGGITLIIFARQPIGWLVLGIFSPPYMLLYWYKKQLFHPAPVHDDSIDGIMSAGVLGRLPATPTVYDLGNILTHQTGGRFILNRFGFSDSTMSDIISGSQSDIGDIWAAAMDLRTELGSEVVSSGILILAVISLLEDRDQLLAKYKLDWNDLKSGIRWLDQVQLAASTPRASTGGIARDWAYGYTPTLDRFARNISLEIDAHGGRTMSLSLPSRQSTVQQMIQLLSSNGRSNVTIVAPDGAGKTSVVHDFAEAILDSKNKAIPRNLRYHQVFLLDSAAMIAAAPEPGQIERLMNAVLTEAATAKNIIICLDDAQLFFEQGTGSVDISNLLVPVLEKTRLRLILTMNEQVLLRISQKNPSLSNAINRINIAPASYEETIAAMEDRSIQLEHDKGILYQYQSLKKAYELSERYIHDRAMPGRAIRLMEMSANYAEGRVVTASSVEQAIEQTIGAKVAVADDGAEKQKLLNLEALIHERMVDQTRAVQVVSDALRRARTGVRSTIRPVGTFLFLGPTGVGKTELSKALAEVYYGGEDHMVRVDLNQFITPESVDDLTADGAESPNSLTAGVMKNPFSVVLLDEIEKAHGNVLTALLQVLDEGILRDKQGREISFRDTIIIATSNAGASEIRDRIMAGEDITAVSSEITDQLISSGEFKPEFLNRFDEIVVFGPLGKPELLQIVDLMLAGVNKTLKSQKITVELDPAAKDLLVEAGYDPRLGARPMRRVIQQVVENEVAKQFLADNVTAGGTVRITAEMVSANLGKN